MKKEENSVDLMDANIRELMKTRSGREVIWEILDFCGLYVDNSISVDPGTEGRRSVGLRILELLESADPTIYPKLLLNKQEIKND